jgi:hypothetical protein
MNSQCHVALLSRQDLHAAEQSPPLDVRLAGAVAAHVHVVCGAHVVAVPDDAVPSEPLIAVHVPVALRKHPMQQEWAAADNQ